MARRNMTSGRHLVRGTRCQDVGCFIYLVSYHVLCDIKQNNLSSKKKSLSHQLDCSTRMRRFIAESFLFAWRTYHRTWNPECAFNLCLSHGHGFSDCVLVCVCVRVMVLVMGVRVFFQFDMFSTHEEVFNDTLSISLLTLFCWFIAKSKYFSVYGFVVRFYENSWGGVCQIHLFQFVFQFSLFVLSCMVIGVISTKKMTNKHWRKINQFWLIRKKLYNGCLWELFFSSVRIFCPKVN